MKNHKKIALFFCMILFTLNLLQSTTEPVHEETKLVLRSVELDIIAILGYLSLSMHACETHFEKNNIKPTIKCKHCSTKKLDYAEFIGNLVGTSLREIADGKDSFNTYKTHFEDFLAIIAEASYDAAVNSMVRIANATQIGCPHCHYRGSDDHWEKIENATAHSGAYDC